MKEKKILYAVSGLNEWVDLAKRLHRQHNWKPVYWITTHQIEGKVKDEFPDIIHHDVYDANKGIYHNKYADISFPLDTKIINDFLNYEKVALKLMDRQDPYDDFSYQKRKRFYYNQLKYWLSVLKEEKIDLLFLTESPHLVTHYICYAVCQYYNIDTIMFSAITIPGLIYPKINFEDVPKYRIDENTSDSSLIHKLILEYINNYVDIDNYQKPWFMLEQEKKESKHAYQYLGLLSKLLKYVPKIFTKEGVTKLGNVISNKLNLVGKKLGINDNYVRSYILKEGHLLEKSFLKESEKRHMIKRGNQKNKELQTFYRIVCENFNFKKNQYLYFPLHYQPERTTSPEGHYFTDQLLAINMLSYYLPDSLTLVVKEHPSQFITGMQGYMGRTTDFYSDTKELKNVKFVNEKIDSLELIEESEAVITLTGSAGLEALIREKPVFAFGFAWYRDMPGVFHIKDRDDCKKALDAIESGYTMNLQEVKNSLLSLKAFCVRGYLNPSTRKGIDITPDEHLEELYKGITALIPDLERYKNADVLNQ